MWNGSGGRRSIQLSYGRMGAGSASVADLSTIRRLSPLTETPVTDPNWWQRLIRKHQLERQADDELRYHFDRLVADHLAAGMSEDEAPRKARLGFRRAGSGEGGTTLASRGSTP
jgi:hypothetical protein